MARKRKMPEPFVQPAKDAIAKHRGRIPPPHLEIERDHLNGNWSFGSPYRKADDDQWFALVFQALGTRSTSVATAFANQLANLSPELFDGDLQKWVPDQSALDQAVAILNAIQPQNEAEACAAAQAVALHFATMKLGANIAKSSYPNERSIATMARANRAYTSTLETLAALQGKGTRKLKQTIEVRTERHVYFYRDGQPAGGAGDFGERGEGCGEITRARATASIAGECPALPCPDAPGDALPVACREGPDPVPDSRGSEGERRAEGRAERRLSPRGLHSGSDSGSSPRLVDAEGDQGGCGAGRDVRADTGHAAAARREADAG